MSGNKNIRFFWKRFMENKEILIKSQFKKELFFLERNLFVSSLPLRSMNGIKKKQPERQEGDKGT